MTLRLEETENLWLSMGGNHLEVCSSHQLTRETKIRNFQFTQTTPPKIKSKSGILTVKLTLTGELDRLILAIITGSGGLPEMWVMK